MNEKVKFIKKLKFYMGNFVRVTKKKRGISTKAQVIFQNKMSWKSYRKTSTKFLGDFDHTRIMHDFNDSYMDS